METNADKSVILVVDDDRLMVNMLGGLLNADYKVLVATGGEQALKRAKGDVKPDLILLDVVMPEMDGYQVYEHLKADSATCDIPVMFLTAKSTPEEETRGLELGAVDYIAKPITPSIVMARIERYMSLKKLTQQLEVKNESLQEEILKRRQMENALLLAKEQAEAANEAKSSFIAHVSHEIRTPLNCILGVLQLAVDTDDAEQITSYLNSAHSSAESMVTILNDLLDLSKINAGRLEIVKADLPLKALVEETAELLGAPSLEKGLILDVEVAEDLPAVVRMDGLRIRQVLLNLGSNATKFTHEGRVSIRVAAKDSEDGPLLEFCVRDTGIGISEEQQKDLFTPYTQLQHQKYGGTGLGLSICKKLVELMGGAIVVESQLGEGTEFRFYIPLEEGVGADNTENSEIKHPHLTGVRVLLVDDTPLNLEVTSTLLRQNGIDVITANSGDQALKILGNGSFDAILMDIHMPQKDGFATSQEIREQDSWGDIPIVALTADLVTTDLDMVKAAGMNDLLGKPVDVSEILSKLAKWVPTSRITQQSNTEDGPKDDGVNGFEGLNGFDTSWGLMQSQNNRDRYVGYLTLFRDSLARDVEALSVATENSDKAAIYKVLHSIKGAAPIIGAADIQGSLDAISLTDCSDDELGNIQILLRNTHTQLNDFLD